MTNGRGEYLERTLSTLGKLHGDFSRILIHDDSGDEDYHNWLKQFNYELATTKRVGFTEAMISAWQKLKEDSNEWVFHLEDDFLILDDILLNNMIDVMRQNEHIKQLVLLRQPLGGRELKKGGIIASHPERYEEKTDGIYHWVEHRIGFSCNPCVYRKSLIFEYPWPNMPHSEREYGRLLFKNPNVKCAYWGGKTDKPKVEHIGVIKKGFGH
ncbi:MAG: hypothetical protein AAB837_02880 [Patescibacteria group bacterium]